MENLAHRRKEQFAEGYKVLEWAGEISMVGKNKGSESMLQLGLEMGWALR